MVSVANRSRTKPGHHLFLGHTGVSLPGSFALVLTSTTVICRCGGSIILSVDSIIILIHVCAIVDREQIVHVCPIVVLSTRIRRSIILTIVLAIRVLCVAAEGAFSRRWRCTTLARRCLGLWRAGQ